MIILLFKDLQDFWEKYFLLNQNRMDEMKAFIKFDWNSSAF